jgi:hypothetical protein
VTLGPGDLGLGVDLHGVGVCANIRLLLLTFGVSLSVTLENRSIKGLKTNGQYLLGESFELKKLSNFNKN